MNYQMHFDPYLTEHLKQQREEDLVQQVEMLALQRRLRKNRKVVSYRSRSTKRSSTTTTRRST
jgi:hypothetical protein